MSDALPGLDEFHLRGDDITDSDLLASAFPAFSDADFPDDVDFRSACKKVQTCDILTFPHSDIVPGGFDDSATVRSGVVAFGHDEQTGGPGVSVVLDIGIPDLSLEFNFV